MMRWLSSNNLVQYIDEIQSETIKNRYNYPFKADTMLTRAAYQRSNVAATPLAPMLVDPTDHGNIFEDKADGGEAQGEGEKEGGDNWQEVVMNGQW